MISNTTNTSTSKIERAVPCSIYNEADILEDILRDLNHQAKAEPHRTMEEILDRSPYNARWKQLIGFEGRQFKPLIKIERRRAKKTQNKQ